MIIHFLILMGMSMASLAFADTPNSGLQFVFKNQEYNYQGLRAVAATTGGAADYGECFVTASAISDGDDESWYKEWNILAQRIEKMATESLQKKQTVSASSAFMRASNYYRSAEFFLHTNPQDPRIIETWRKGKEAFLNSVKASGANIVEIKIPFETTTLPGYFCVAEGQTKEKKPLLILQTGFDGTAEELYYTVGYAAVKRGYHCLIFEGPGQGEVIRVQGIPFRYNWESVITPVVNFAIKLKEINPQKIVLMGLSMGGYLVPRALAFEKRIKIGIVNGGVYDLHQVFLGPELASYEFELDNPAVVKEVNAAILAKMKTDAGLRWAFGNAMYVFKVNSPIEVMKITQPYNLREVAREITCKMLVIDSENDFQMKGPSKKLFDALRSPKEYMFFTNKEGAGEHCQVGAYALSHERIFNWLDENLK